MCSSGVVVEIGWVSCSGFVVEIEAVVEVHSVSGWEAPVKNGHTESAGGGWRIMVVISLCVELLNVGH